MTDSQIKQLAIVAAVALIMAGILLYWVLDARRRRADEREADARRLEVRVALLAAEGGDWGTDDFADLLDDRLAAAGIGGVADMHSRPAQGAADAGRTEIAIDVVLTAGRSAMPALKHALRESGLPAGAHIEYLVHGVEVRERLGR